MATAPISAVQLYNASDDADDLGTVVNGGPNDIAVNRVGNSLRTLAYYQQKQEEALLSLGYEVPVPYAAGINLTSGRQTVEFNGLTYAPIVSALPFTTSGTFETAKFRLITGVTASDLSGTGGASLIGVDAPVAYTAQDKFDERISIAEKGAVSNGVTSDGPAFTLTENDPDHDQFYMPEGVAPTGGNSLSKRYFGPGTARFNSGFAIPGTPSSLQKVVTLGNTGPNIYAGTTQARMVVWCGDSKTDGEGLTMEQAWPAMIQERAGRLMTSRQGSYLSGGNLERAVVAGTVTADTSGPFSDQQGAKRLAAGASLTITASWIDVLWFYFKREPGAGAITTTDADTGAVLIPEYSCAGTAADSVRSAETDPPLLGRANRRIRFTNTGSAPVTMNGIWASHLIAGPDYSPIVFMHQSRGGMTSTSFTKAGVLSSIFGQMPYQANKPLLWFSCMENDMNRVGQNPLTGEDWAITAEQFGANLETICTNWRGLGGDFIFEITMRRPVNPLKGGTFDDFRNIAYEKARKMNFDVVDQSEADIAGAGGIADGVHENYYGSRIRGDRNFSALRLGDITSTDFIQPLSFPGGSPVVAVGAPFGPAQARLCKEKTYLSGTLNVTGVAVGSAIAIQSPYTTSRTRKAFTVPMLAADGSAVNCVATITTSPDWFIRIESINGTGGVLVCLDGITYPTFE